MHRASAPAQQAPKTTPVPDTPAHQDRAYEFVECPMKAARGETGAMSDINPANMVRQRKFYTPITQCGYMKSEATVN